MVKIYQIYATEEFMSDYDKLSKSEKDQIDKIREQLKTNPFVGKPLGYRFFREKKIGRKRIYYLIYEDIVVVLMVAISDKKTQQATIDAIKIAFERYREDIRDKFKNN